MSINNSTVFLAFLLVSCASPIPTPYQQEINSEGYSELKLSPVSYQVSFKANELSGDKRIYDFALLRGAQLTLIKGFRYFTVINTETFVSYKRVELAQVNYPVSDLFLNSYSGSFFTTRHTLSDNNICEMVDSSGNLTRVNMTGPLASDYYQKMNDRHFATTPVTTTFVDTEIDQSSGNLDLLGYPINEQVNQSSIQVAMPEIVTIIHFEVEKINKPNAWNADEIIKQMAQKYQIKL